MIIITNGTLMSIQNMTFGGQLGFQQKPATPIVVPGEPGGVQHYERGLLWTEAFGTGHMGPEWYVVLKHIFRVFGRLLNTMSRSKKSKKRTCGSVLPPKDSYANSVSQSYRAPKLAYRHLEWLLRLRETL